MATPMKMADLAVRRSPTGCLPGTPGRRKSSAMDRYSSIRARDLAQGEAETGEGRGRLEMGMGGRRGDIGGEEMEMKGESGRVVGERIRMELGGKKLRTGVRERSKK